MIRYKYIHVLFCLLAGLLSAQENSIDSLKNLLTKKIADTSRCKVLSELALNASDDEWPGYNLQLLKFTEERYSNNKLSQREKALYTENLAVAYNNVGFLAKKQGDIPKALEFYFKALKMHEAAGNKKEMGTLYNNIGRIYGDQEERTKELEYFMKSLIISEEIHYKKGISGALNNLGGYYHELNDTANALKYFTKALAIMKESNDYKYMGRTINNIGRIYEYQQNNKTAFMYYEQAFSLQKKIKDKGGMATSLNSLAYISIKEGLFAKAKTYAIQSLALSQELGYPASIKNAAKNLRKIYRHENNSGAALEMFELEVKMSDSINSEQSKKSTIRKQFQFEFDKKSTADSVKNTEAQKVQDAQLKAQAASLKEEKTQGYVLSGGLILIGGFLIFVFNRFRIINRQKKIIEEQKLLADKAFDQLNEKNKEVLDSIYYARRIQQALLASEKYIERTLKRLN